MRRYLLAMLACVLCLAGCYPAVTQTPPVPGPSSTPPFASAAPKSTPGLTKVTLAMGYVPSVQFAPLYLAQKRGYFRDAGLDVTFRYGIETDLLKLVGTDQLQFMIGSGEEVILGRSQGLPVRYVMRWYRRFPSVLFAKADKGIKSTSDLIGKQVGIPGPFGANYVGWLAIVYGSGLDASKVNLKTIGFTQATAVSQNQVDAAMDYSVSGPVQLREAGQAVTVIPVTDYVDLPSNGIITNDRTIRDHPEMVQAVVSAILRGLSDTLADPDAAFVASLEAVPEAGGAQSKVSRAIFDESLRLWQAEPGTLGHSDPAAWANAEKFMKQMGLIQQDVPTDDLYTNAFVR